MNDDQPELRPWEPEAGFGMGLIELDDERNPIADHLYARQPPVQEGAPQAFVEDVVRQHRLDMDRCVAVLIDADGCFDLMLGHSEPGETKSDEEIRLSRWLQERHPGLRFNGTRTFRFR